MIISIDTEKTFDKIPCSLLIKKTDFLQRCKGSSVEKGPSFQQIVPAQLVILMPKMNFNLFLIPYAQINSKSIIELNVKLKTMKLLKETQDKIFLPLVRQRFQRYANSIMHKRKKWANWTSSEEILAFKR